MVSHVKWSEEQFVDLLISKMTSRCKEICWGSNADTVRDALKFEEGIFVSDFENANEKNEFFQFLWNEGFRFKGKRIDGVDSTEWFFSTNPKNPKIVDFLEWITRDYENALEVSKAGARDVIESFIESEEYFKYFVVDGVERKALNEEVAKYNQETIVYNNKRNANYQRPFIINVAHPKYPIVLIFKQQEDADILIKAERFYLDSFWQNVYKTLYSINSAMIYADLSNRKMLVHIEKEYAFGFKLLLEWVGLKVDYFSILPQASYVDVMRSLEYSHDDSVSLFVEISKPLICNEDFVQENNPLMQKVLNECTRFCSIVNKNVF